MELLTTIKNNSTQFIVIMAVILLASTATMTALGGGLTGMDCCLLVLMTIVTIPQTLR